MGYDDPIPEVTPEERERNLNRSLADGWAEAEEHLLDKLGETLDKRVAEREASADEGETSTASPAA